jgi:two-component system sensor histidine kinase/response regulator
MTPHSRKVAILAVDDLEQNLLSLEAVLDRPDICLLKATSGSEALELLLKEPVALALIDVRMPGMDGFELAELMRGSPRTRDVPIIFLTAGERSENRMFRGYEAGAVDFLHKPFDPHVLRSKVDVFVKLWRQQAQLAEQLEALQEALRLNEMFTAAMGHDLRSPLNAILLNAQLIARIGTEPTVLDISTRIRNSGRRMSQMIEQLLDMARIRAGSMTLSLDDADLHQIVQPILEEVRQVSAREVRLQVHGDTQGVWDGTRIGQVLANLIGNAAQHGEESQPITVVVDGRRADAIEISVANAGAIREDLLPHIFEPFRSIGSSKDRIGLGLYIVRELTRHHGGQVSVRSSRETGTEFRIELPRTTHAAGPQDESASS